MDNSIFREFPVFIIILYEEHVKVFFFFFFLLIFLLWLIFLAWTHAWQVCKFHEVIHIMSGRNSSNPLLVYDNAKAQRRQANGPRLHSRKINSLNGYRTLKFAKYFPQHFCYYHGNKDIT